MTPPAGSKSGHGRTASRPGRGTAPSSGSRSAAGTRTLELTGFMQALCDSGHVSQADLERVLDKRRSTEDLRKPLLAFIAEQNLEDQRELAKAIRLGSMRRPQCFGSYFDDSGGSCALGAVYPTERRRGAQDDPFSLILDAGLTLDVSADDLVSFAIMGSAYASRISKNPAPRVALLSNGSGTSVACACSDPPHIVSSYSLGANSYVRKPVDFGSFVTAIIGAIILSNHGGRQLDRAPSPLEVLPGIRAAVGDKVTVLMDSGIRRGSDVIIARFRRLRGDAVRLLVGTDEHGQKVAQAAAAWKAQRILANAQRAASRDAVT